MQYPDYFPGVNPFVPVAAYLDRAYTPKMHVAAMIPQDVQKYVHTPSGQPPTLCCLQCCGVSPPDWPAGEPQAPELLGASKQPFYKPHPDKKDKIRFFGYHLSSFMSPTQLYMKMFCKGAQFCV